ncbi:hypothetical protein QL285_044933 [Trifolium repens]|nr:hypothetical protein QL285_044933 [Trifolium repens]
MASPNDSFKKSSDESKRNAQTVSPKKQREADADVQRHVSKKKKKSTSPLRASCLGGCVPDQFAQAHIRLSPLLTHLVRPTRHGGLRAHCILIRAQFAH